VDLVFAEKICAVGFSFWVKREVDFFGKGKNLYFQQQINIEAPLKQKYTVEFDAHQH
jgi:hypothetical protein